MMAAWALMTLVVAAAPPQEPAPAAAEGASARELIFLAETRPVFLRLRVTSQGRPFEASWIDSIRTIYASLDRNGDGTLTTKEADPATLNAIVRLTTGSAVPALEDLDVRPKNGTISYDELTEGLRPILGPFRLEVGRQPTGRTDALFEQLDRDKDSVLTRPELAAIAGSLRPLDFDDNEMIGADEIESFTSAAFAALAEDPSDRRGRFTALPPVVELVDGESTLRPARLLLKRYDKGKGDVPGRPDNKLSPSEFAIDPDTFAAADKNGDDMLDTEELRKFLAGPPVDLTLDVSLSQAAPGRTTIKMEAGATLPKGTQIRRLADGDVEFAIGQIRLDVHVEDGNGRAEQVHRILQQQFKAADANKDGYLEGKELAALNGPQSPMAGLSGVIDRDGDKKIYPKELIAFADHQAEAALARLVVTTADQGRAIFGILDLDRDRRLGAREVMRTVDRVMSWDADGDARVSPDEIPYHFQVNIDRGGLSGLTGTGMVNPVTRSVIATRAAGPDWFEKMDRNQDGDVSRREFLGSRDQFERLDRDQDGLIDAEEARAAVAAKAGGRP